MFKQDILFLILILCSVTRTFGQNDSLVVEDVVMPNEEYYFDNDSMQYYNYSNMWDFDGDQIKDSLLFIGDHGAHVHFYPVVVLSTNSTAYIYDHILLDMPWPETNKDKISNSLCQLVVDNFDDDAAFEIYLKLDDETWKLYQQSISSESMEFKLSSNSLLLDFEDN